MQSFRYERDMMPVLEAGVMSALSIPIGWHTRLLREPNLRGVVPDLLVGASPAPFPEEHALAAAHSPIEGAVVHALRENGQLSIEDLAVEVFATPVAVQRALDRLASAGLATGDFMGCAWSISAAVELPVGVVAVEAKLSDWRRALSQAQSYRAFAQQVFVALDRGRVSLDDGILAAFRTSSVGLMLVSPTSVETVVAPGPPSRPTPGRYQAIARILRA